VWGDFYAKDGKQNNIDAIAYNANFGTDPDGTTTDFSGWIATPDGGSTSVPDASIMLLLGSAFIALGLFRRKKAAK
jgi:hypothetical protein